MWGVSPGEVCVSFVLWGRWGGREPFRIFCVKGGGVEKKGVSFFLFEEIWKNSIVFLEFSCKMDVKEFFEHLWEILYCVM